jgi:hypothetical protein
MDSMGCWSNSNNSLVDGTWVTWAFSLLVEHHYASKAFEVSYFKTGHSHSLFIP